MIVKNALFFMALLGFGLKAGMMPLHFWLPSAHANAPSHVSAMLSGIVLKMGIYGLLRMLSLLPSPLPIWGGLILFLGVVSGLLGVVFAIGQHDLKRLLAYHSVENIGIILMGLGLAMLGRCAHRPEWVVLGLAGCLLHVWNHSLFKSLLFLCAGSVVHGAHTREIDRLGGLAKVMPWTAGLFVVGAVAICGLPPLNGFVSELLVYMGSLQGALGGRAGGSGGAGWIGGDAGCAGAGDDRRAGGGVLCESDWRGVSGWSANERGGQCTRVAAVDADAGDGAGGVLYRDWAGADGDCAGSGCRDRKLGA